MSRYRTNELRIDFGQVSILPEGGVLADTTTTMSVEFGTEVQATVSGVPHIADRANVQGRMPVAVVEDFATREDAFKRQVVVASQLKQEPVADLVVRDGSVVAQWRAGVTSASFSLSLTGHPEKPFRLVAQYEFALGEEFV